MVKRSGLQSAPRFHARASVASVSLRRLSIVA